MTLLSLGGCFPFNRFKGWGLGDFSGEGSGEWGNGDQVPTAVHERWKNGSKEDKEAMIEELEKVNWSKDLV